MLTAGHTPGHQSFVVDLEGGGGFVFAFDAAPPALHGRPRAAGPARLGRAPQALAFRFWPTRSAAWSGT